MIYVFRLPKFPVLVDIGDRLLAARTRAQLDSKLGRLELPDEQARAIIDANAQRFMFHPATKIIAPCVGMRWTKQQIIDRYNRRREPGSPAMRSASLGSRTLQHVVAEAVELLIRVRAADRLAALSAETPDMQNVQRRRDEP
ncbi:MAG: hypothetical protein ACOZJZ_12185 [Pseudomonadota bacterium]